MGLLFNTRPLYQLSPTRKVVHCFSGMLTKLYLRKNAHSEYFNFLFQSFVPLRNGKMIIGNSFSINVLQKPTRVKDIFLLFTMKQICPK